MCLCVCAFDGTHVPPQLHDLVENRIDKNVRIVAKVNMATLPTDTSFALEDFVSTQELHVKAQIQVSTPLALFPPCFLSDRC